MFLTSLSCSPGALVNYTTTNNCNTPLDDYVEFLTGSLAGLGFLVLRKSLQIRQNQIAMKKST